VIAGRLVIALGALLLGALILRAPALRIGNRGAHVGEAREESAYGLGHGAVVFPLAAGTRSLRLLLNFDLPSREKEALTELQTAPGAPTPYLVRVRLSPDGRDQTFALPGTKTAGATAFYLDSAKQPSRTSLLGIERDRDEEGSLEVALVDPAAGTGVVRLQSLQNRALGTAAPAWVGMPAAGSAQRRRIYFEPPASRESAPPSLTLARGTGGIWLGPARVETWTVMGPATLTLAAEEGRLRGHVRLVSADGATSDRAVDLPAGLSLSFPVGQGWTTLRLTASAPARVLLSGPASAAGSLARAVALADGRTELRARPTVVEATRVDAGVPDGTRAVIFDLGGRREDAALKLDVRVLMKDDGDAAPVHVSWRAVDVGRRVLAHGTTAEPVRAAPEDRVLGSDRWLSEPAALLVWPPVEAVALEITADRDAEVTGASPAWVDDARADAVGDPDADDEQRTVVGLAPTVRLRHGPSPAFRQYFGVAPANRAALLAAGRVDRLALAPRLETVPRPAPVAAESLTPVGHLPRVEMLVPDSSSARLPTQLWAVPVGREVTFASDGGSASVIYAGDTTVAGGAATVTLDGHVVARAQLFTARGQLAIAAAPGAHHLRVDVPSSTRVFLNRPIGRTAMFRRVAVYALAPGQRAHLRLRKAGGRHVVGLVLYGSGAVGAEVRLAIRIDGGARLQRGFLSHSRTALDRLVPVAILPMASTVPLNTAVAPTWQSRPIFIALGDDLAARTHDLAISIAGVKVPVFVRVFGHAVDARTGAGASRLLAWDLGT
jgi:hypothetical protein